MLGHGPLSDKPLSHLDDRAPGAVPEMAWAPSYPTLPRRRPFAVAMLMAAMVGPIEPPAPPPAAPELSWQPKYSDFARAAKRPVNVGGLFAPSANPIPNPPAPDFVWSTYPDIVRGLKRQPHLLPAATYVPSGAGSVLSIGKAHAIQREFGDSPETGTWTTPSTDLTATPDHTTDTLTTTAHGMTTPDGPYYLAISSGGSFPTGLDGTTPYYIDVTNANDYKLSTSAANAKAGTNVAFSDNGSGTLTLVRTINTNTVGSALVVFAARGFWNLDGSAPTDSFNNSLTAAAGSPRAYASFPDSSTWVGYKINAKGGPIHTFSASFVNFDEPTVGGLEIYGATELAASSHVERAIGSTTITSASVTVSRRALLLAFIWGNGPTGQDHTFTFNDGFTKIVNASDEGDLSNNGYIQVSVAYKVVESAGTYTFSANGVSSEGGQMYLLAFYGPDQGGSGTVPFDWYQHPPDVIRRKARAPLPALTAPPTDTSSQGQIAWQPEYQDFARRHPPRPHGGIYVPPSDTNAGPLCWAPVYPDFARKVPPRPHGGLTAPPSDTNAGPLTWKSVYPDFARGHQPRPHGGLTEPPSDTNAGPLTWAPSYPDFARAARRNPFGGEFDPPSDTNAGPLCWAPAYPDFARKAPPRPHGGHVASPSDTNAGPLCWAPAFPDFARAARRPVNTGGMVTTWDTSDTPLAWHPSFPDFVWAARRPVNEAGAATREVFPIPDAPHASWFPVYPDFALAARRPVNVGGCFQGNPLVIPNPAPDQWAPVYPDFARAKVRPRVGFTVVSPFPQPNEDAPSRAWAPAFPDFARGARRPVNTGGGFQGSPLVIQDPAPFVSCIFPDRVPGTRRSPLGGLFAPPSDTNAGPRCWAPSFPDFARGARRNPFGGITEVPAAVERDLRWLAIFPDCVPSASRNPFGGLSEPPSDTNAGPLCWSPVYPDFARRHRLLWPTGGAVLPELPQPDPAPDLSWQPVYPDFARGPAPRPHGGHIGAPIGAIEYPVVPADVGSIDGYLVLREWGATFEEVLWAGILVLVDTAGGLE